MKRSRFLTAATIAVVAALAISGCSSGGDTSGSSSSGAVTDGGDLVMARADDSTSLLPPETSTNIDIWMLQQIYQGLTVNNKAGTGVDPALATDWTTSDDELTWTFTIRQGVKFHDGAEMTAKDVVWSLNYARTESDTNQWYSLFAPISTVDQTDDYTVTIGLAQAWPALPEYLALYAAAIYPANFGGKDEAYMREHTDGTGPFKLKEWVKGQYLTIEKNADYWDAANDVPHLDSVKFTVVPDDNTRVLQLQGGQIDIDEFPSAASMDVLKQSSGIVAKQFDSTQVMFININNKQPGLDDPLVRRALSYAVDRESIIKTVLSGVGTPANSFLSPGLAGYDKSVDGATFDMDLAKQTLAKSGSPDGLKLTIEIAAGVTDREQIAQILQQSWGELGIDVTIAPVDATVASTDRSAGNFDVQIGYATSDVVDPYEMVSFLVLTDGAGINSGYTDKDVYDLAASMQVESDTTKRDALLAQIQQKVADDAPIIPIAFQPVLYAYSDKVSGFATDVLGTYTLPVTSKSD